MKSRQANIEPLSEPNGYHASWDAQKNQWRRGNTSAQAHKALRNKAVMSYIKENPGCTASEIHAALGHGGFDLLQRHKLAFYIKVGTHDARWYLESDRCRLAELEAARRTRREGDKMQTTPESTPQ